MPRPIEVSNLSVAYAGVQALENVSFDVDQGEFLGIIGPNGAGKSTLFACMLGLNTQYAGTVRIFGQNIHRSKGPLKKIGYVPQMMHFERNFPVTVREVIQLGMWHGVQEERVDEVMRELWIHELADRRIGELSGGQQQRVFIAKAMVNDPKMLILDEPVTGVDQASMSLFYGILKDLNSNHGITIMWSSHDLDAIKMMSSHVACLNRTLYFHGAAKEFFSDEKLVQIMCQCADPSECMEHNPGITEPRPIRNEAS